MTLNDLYDYLIKKKLCTIYRDARSYYKTNEGSRFYHNAKHADRVVETVLQLTENPSPELILAAAWHDAVYIPGSQLNEEMSAEALRDCYDVYAVFIPGMKSTIGYARQLIRKTTISDHLSKNRLEGDLAILLDADLVALADPYDQFIENQQNILRENHLKDTELQKSASFLTNFLSRRDYIYHTDKGREVFEDKARKNIELLIDEYL